MNFTLSHTTAASLQDGLESNYTLTTAPITTDMTKMTTAIPFYPVDPPLEKCNYYITRHGPDNETFVLFKEAWYGGIPQNLAFNLIGWLLLMILFSLLRRAAGNYGRLALVRKDDQDETSKWTQLFFAPDDVTGRALSDYPDGPTFAATGNINRIVQRDIENENHFLAEDDNDTSVVAAEEALKEDKHFFAWIIKIFTLSDEKFLRKCGTDAVQYLKFQRHLILFVTVMMVMCICVILPINFQGELQGDNSDFGHTTISNLNGSADWLWIHAIMTVLFFPIGILIMRRFSVGLGLTEDIYEDGKATTSSSTAPSGYTSYENEIDGVEGEEQCSSKINAHGKYNGGDLIGASRTLMISGIPSTYCTKEFLHRHFQEAYPNLNTNIHDIEPAYDVSKLLSLDDKRQRARKARIYCEGEAAKHGAGQQMCPYPCGIVCMKFDDCCGECSSCCSKRTVDALTFYREEELRLMGEVEREKARVQTTSIGIAFVTFATREDAKTVASDHRLGNCGACLFWACSFLPNSILRALCCGKRPPASSLSNLLDPGKWSVRYSPHPDDIYWENLSESQHLFVFKAVSINLFLFIALFFFTSPSYILSQITLILNIKKIGTQLHLPDKMNDFAPTLLLWTIAALLPILVAYTDWWMGHWRRSAENLWIMRKVFFYLLFMVLILPSIGLTTLKGLIENFIHSAEIAPTNSSTNANYTMMWECIFLPDNGAFFINYVVTSTLVGTALEFMRFSELFMYAFRMCFARSVAEYTSVRKANLYEFPFGFNYGWMLLIFALTAAYAVICPIITPFGLFYLVMKHGVDRYNLYYAYKRSKISKQIHATAVNSVIVSLLIQQLVLLFFNVIRGQNTEGGRFSPRAIFSITMFAIFLAMFVGQIFFHMFLGFSPIQYNPTSESPPRSNKHSNVSSRRDSKEKVERNGNELDEELGKPSAEEVDGTEFIYGEFRQFDRHTDVGMQLSSREDIFQIPEDDGFTNHRLPNRRRQRPIGNNSKKNTKRFVPDVLRNDVFSTDQNIYPQPQNNSIQIQQSKISNGQRDKNVTTIGEPSVSSWSNKDVIQSSSSYGAIDQQPKGSDRTKNRV